MTLRAPVSPVTGSVASTRSPTRTASMLVTERSAISTLVPARKHSAHFCASRAARLPSIAPSMPSTAFFSSLSLPTGSADMAAKGCPAKDLRESAVRYPMTSRAASRNADRLPSR